MTVEVVYSDASVSSLPEEATYLQSELREVQDGPVYGGAPSNTQETHIERSRKRTTAIPTERLLDEIEGVDGKNVAAIQLLEGDARSEFAQELASAYGISPDQRLHRYFVMLLTCNDAAELKQAQQGRAGLPRLQPKPHH